MFFRAFIFVLALGLSFAASGQKPGTVFPTGTSGVDYNRRDASGKKEGPWIRVYRDQPGILYYRGQFRSGVPVGVFEFYNADGQLSSRVNHVQDSTINDVTFFHPDGVTVKSQGRYTGSLQDGKWTRVRQGNWKTWDAAGILRADEQYTDDRLDGSCRYYYPGGKLLAEYVYRSGRLSGPFSTWYDNGKKEKEGAYVNDEFDGGYKSWLQNGMPESEGKYHLGRREGTWHFFTPGGSVEVSILYKKGNEVRRKYMNGTFTEYYASGIPKSEYTYEEGKKSGPFREWYDAGQFVQVPGSQEDASIGIQYREKLEGTQVSREGDYLDDHPEGEIRHYSLQGRLEKTEIWEGGVMKSSSGPGK
jgi:uncharacterized protein